MCETEELDCRIKQLKYLQSEQKKEQLHKKETESDQQAEKHQID